MEKIIIPSLLSVSDGVLMAERILENSLPLTVTDPKMLNLHTRLTSVKNRLVKNQAYSKKSLLTEDLIQLGKRRNNALNALRDILHGMSVSLTEETGKKAAKLYAIMTKHSAKAYRMGYKEETAKLISLFSDLDLPANQALLTDLNVLPFYESLKAAHLAFDTTNKQKSEQITELNSDSEAATTILVELIPAMTDLMAMVQLNNQLDPANYGEVYKQLLTHISEINTTARARKTRKQNNNNITGQKPETA